MKDQLRGFAAPLAVVGLVSAGAIDQELNQGKVTHEVATVLAKTMDVAISDAHAGAGDYAAQPDTTTTTYGFDLPDEADTDGDGTPEWVNIWGSAGDPSRLSESGNTSPYFLGVDSDGDNEPDTLMMTTNGTWAAVSDLDPIYSYPSSYSPNRDELVVSEYASDAAIASGYGTTGALSSITTFAHAAGRASVDDATGTIYSTYDAGSEYRPATFTSSGYTYQASLDNILEEAGLICDTTASVCAFTDNATDQVYVMDMSTATAYATGAYGEVTNFQPARGVYGNRFTVQDATTDFSETDIEDFTTIGSADDDGDGVSVEDDCDDADATVGAPSTWYEDADGDGVGDAAASEEACAQPSGSVETSGDCDDADAGRFPGNTVTENDGVDNNCEDDAPSINGLSIGGLEVYPTITADPINLAVGETVPLIATGLDDEDRSSGLTYEWTVQKPNGDYEVLTGASVDFVPEESGAYSVSLRLVDADGNAVTDSGNNFSANFSASELPEGTELSEGDMIYEDPTDPEGSDSAEVSGDPYVAADGSIVLDDAGDGVSVDGVELDVTSEPSNVTLSTGDETHSGIFLGGTDYTEFAPPPSAASSTYGEYADSENTDDLTMVDLQSGSVWVRSANAWEGDNGIKELDVNLSTPGSYWVGDTIDNDDGQIDTGGGDSGGEETGETGTPDTDSAGEDSDTVQDPDGNNEDTDGEDAGEGCGCATSPDGAAWYGIGLGAVALASRRRRK